MIRLLCGLSFLLFGGCRGPTFDVPSQKVVEQLKAETVRALQQGPVTLVSLHPAIQAVDPEGWARGGFEANAKLDGFPVLGECTLDPQAQRRVVHSLFDGIHDNDGTVAACFNPRHGLRADLDGKRYDLVICFECMSLRVLCDGTRIGSALTTPVPSGQFNQVLRAAGVPLPVR